MVDCFRNFAQLLFLSGVSLTMGLKKTGRFFFQAHKWKGTTSFLGGIVLVLYGWAFIGIIVEGWGFLNLFGDFFPTALCVRRSHLRDLQLPRARKTAALLSAAGLLEPDLSPMLCLPFCHSGAGESCAICPSSATSSRSGRCVQ